MKFIAPELAHQFGVRLHAKMRVKIEELERWCLKNGLPELIVTAISRDPAFYADGRFSWHLVDCALDLRNKHLDEQESGIVAERLRATCPHPLYEVITKDHGTGPHFHAAYRDYSLRRKYEQSHKEK